MSNLGGTDKVLRKQARLAEDGGDCLLAHAAMCEEVERVMTVVRCTPHPVAPRSASRGEKGPSQMAGQASRDW